MIEFLCKVALYTFVLFHVTGSAIDIFLVGIAIVALEFFSYARGIEYGLELQLEKVKNDSSKS